MIDYYGNGRSEMLQFIPKSAKNILEIGCGSGAFLMQLKENGFQNVSGIELNKTAAQSAIEKGLNVYSGPIEDFTEELKKSQFDVIVLNDVIEHILDPWDILNHLRDILSPNGSLVCSIPNVRFIGNLRHLLIEKDWKYEAEGVLDQTHLRFFTKKSIFRTFQECQFTITQIEGIHKTKSLMRRLYWLYLNITTFSRNSDVPFLQFAVVAQKTNPA
jgi:2-polyprenyl-3-methyl-5-hydroxy-6-metoxy-1,4-benzoquinol methylase